MNEPEFDEKAPEKRDDELQIQYISLEEARELGHEVCAKFRAAFELLKDK